MNKPLKKIFAAVAVATSTLAAACSPSPAMTPEEQQKLSAVANTFNQVLYRAQQDAITRPDMRALGVTAIQRIADKEAGDALILTDAERKALEDVLADNQTDRAQLFVDMANLLGNMGARAITQGQPVDQVTAFSVDSIKEMVAGIDPHSSYVTDEEFRQMQTKTTGKFGGLGIQVEMRSGILTVVSPIDNTPASRAGMQPNDHITHIDGQPTKDMTLEEAVDRMRGDVNTRVTLTVERNGAALPPLTLIRGTIPQTPVASRTIGADIGYVRLSSFSAAAQQDMFKAIEDLKKTLGPGMGGLVLDLRGNPGGLVDQAVAVSDLFLEQGRIVSYGTGAPNDRYWNARRGDILDGLPLVVLTDYGSASASEIVAGALQDNGRALVLGTQTFGKGSVQTIIPLTRGATGGLRLTTALYFTPSGDSIQNLGIVPDVKFESPEIREFEAANNNAMSSEAHIPGAIANPNTGVNNVQTRTVCEPAPGVDTATVGQDLKRTLQDGTIWVDYQLACAVEHLRGTPPGVTTTKPFVPPAPAP